MIDHDTIAADYLRHRRVHPEVLRALCVAENLAPYCRVLEVGCGTGNYTAALAAAVGCACWGIDPPSEMLARAREQAPAACFQVGRAEEQSLPAGHFDLVFSVDVIHQVKDRAAGSRADGAGPACRPHSLHLALSPPVGSKGPLPVAQGV
jgi:ubiquinone/menaquinone biosynthesis C-methylase UbiE